MATLTTTFSFRLAGNGHAPLTLRRLLDIITENNNLRRLTAAAEGEQWGKGVCGMLHQWPPLVRSRSDIADKCNNATPPAPAAAAAHAATSFD